MGCATVGGGVDAPPGGGSYVVPGVVVASAVGEGLGLGVGEAVAAGAVTITLPVMSGWMPQAKLYSPASGNVHVPFHPGCPPAKSRPVGTPEQLGPAPFFQLTV